MNTRPHGHVENRGRNTSGKQVDSFCIFIMVANARCIPRVPLLRYRPLVPATLMKVRWILFTVVVERRGHVIGVGSNH